MSVRSNIENQILKLLLLPLVLLVLLVVLLFLPFYGAYRLLLRLTVEICWGSRGRRVLLIYSRSPLWQEYIERNWIPKLENHGLVLNWSDRKEWRRSKSLAVSVFRHWAPTKDFNPMAILFPPLGRTQRIGFFKAFHDFKNGREETLKEAESRLFHFLDDLRPDPD